MLDADPRSLQLDELTQVAYRLGKVFGQAAELPTLRELLARVASTPASAPASARPQPALRTRLTGSAAGVMLAQPPPRRTPSGAPARRRATGPPG